MGTSLIHPTAVIANSAELAPSVEVGAYAVIGEKVKIGSQTVVGPHVVIEGPTEIGTNNRIFPGAVIGLEPQDLKYRGAQSWVKIGDDNLIREYVTINRATDEGEVTFIGNHTLLMAYVHVAHNCVIEDEVVIANNVALAGHVKIQEQATIGGVLGIHQFVQIGKLVMVGGMSRIDRDIPPYLLVAGNPGRVRSLNLIGLQRRGYNDEAISSLKRAYRILYRSGYTLEEALGKLKLLSGSEPLQEFYEFIEDSQQTGRRGLMPGERRSR
ncbi:acyl-ACP--UDP-N-acetylglucosamine O-acyltransferase [Euhalothece natronophila Z-M001]|uniref:Acyl-[acyl-carrier-protein]--UDP-N-acetylglucosamine O-acyltransferase n=1 Tax=Euhalothece natronophila Z-M001 TaxID=522448 RepID=A0A5B8NRY7_9CHRO|nr:acyl-ACP--UDP-N-acetylglucosamine O-acyltransferase [Euhalothece natronophila]QDZ41079.1 acyl-ACP--UDP-N-acetylglucosamine O-acyltransferase [Euhalothece natronophila Z-M001]